MIESGKLGRLRFCVSICLLIALGMSAGLSCQKRVPAPAKLGEPLEFPRAELVPVRHPEWSRNASIYEVNVRQYSPGGTFAEFEEHLPRLKEMGVGILWFMPIHPIGEKNRKGTLGSYYSVKDYYGVNPEFGAMEEFKQLVDKIHGMGMYVIIDWVANHAAWDNPLTEEHPDWFIRDIHGNLVPPVDDWSDVVDLNYGNPELWYYMIDAMRFWVEEVDIDGFRCDVAGMVPLDFWNVARARLDEVKPVFILAEWEAPEAHEYAFDMTYSWGLYHLMNRIAKGLLPASAVGIYLERDREIYSPDAYRMLFTSNHDENSWNGTVFERMGRVAPGLAVLSAALDGMPLVYSGQEAGLDKRLEFFEKDEIDWRQHEMGRLYETLLNLKKHNRALWNGIAGGRAQWVHTADDKAAFAFVRQQSGDRVFVVLNLTGEAKVVSFSGDSHYGTYKDVFSDEPVSVGAETQMNLDPWGFRVLAYTEHGRGLLTPPFIKSDLRAAVAWMTGSFSSREQALSDTNYFDIRLEMRPIWPERGNGYWLYVEQAAADHLDRPYRQRVYHVTEQLDGSIRSDVYEIPDPLRFAGAWKRSDRLGDLTPDSLTVKPGCAVILERVSEGAFEGGTVGEGCLSDLRGARYATSVVRLTPDGLTTWDRGYDADGNQVWGATGGGYVFKRINPR